MFFHRQDGKCRKCGRTAEPLTRVSGGHMVCRDCLQKYYGKCDICGEYAEKDELFVNAGLCEYCYDEEDD